MGSFTLCFDQNPRFSPTRSLNGVSSGTPLQYERICHPPGHVNPHHHPYIKKSAQICMQEHGVEIEHTFVGYDLSVARSLARPCQYCTYSYIWSITSVRTTQQWPEHLGYDLREAYPGSDASVLDGLRCCRKSDYSAASQNDLQL